MDDEEWIIEDPSTAEPEAPPEEAPAEAPAEEAKAEEDEPPPPENVVMGTPRKLIFKHWVRYVNI